MLVFYPLTHLNFMWIRFCKAFTQKIKFTYEKFKEIWCCQGVAIDFLSSTKSSLHVTSSSSLLWCNLFCFDDRKFAEAAEALKWSFWRDKSFTSAICYATAVEFILLLPLNLNKFPSSTRRESGKLLFFNNHEEIFFFHKFFKLRFFRAAT